MSKRNKTYREQFDEALACRTKPEAKLWLAKEIRRYRIFGKKADEARQIILTNLGYMAGYFDDATAKKIYRLFGAVHPIFGTASYHTDVTPEAAFRMGQEFAESLKKGSKA